MTRLQAALIALLMITSGLLGAIALYISSAAVISVAVWFAFGLFAVASGILLWDGIRFLYAVIRNKSK